MMNRRTFVRAAALGVSTVAAPGVLRGEPMAKIRIGTAPFLSSGPIYIAQTKGFFRKVGLEVELTSFADGSLAIPALVAGELDATVATLNAGLFNALSSGGSYKLVLDRGSDKQGFGSTTILVSNKLYDAGATSVDKFGMLKGARFSMQVPGGIDHYLLARGLQRAGLDPRKDAIYSSGLTYPDIIKSLGAGIADAAQIPVPLAFLAETNSAAKILCTGADIEPGAQLACWAMPKKFLETNRKAAVAFAMAHIYAARLFVEAATNKDPGIIKILSDGSKIPGPLIEKAAPRWTGFDKEGAVDTASVLRQADFWVNTMKLIPGPVAKDDIFDPSVASEAAAILSASNPFV